MASSRNDKYDLLLNDFNFNGGLIALAALKAGLKVAIHLKQELDTSYLPELTNYYPNTLKQVPKAIKNYQFLAKCSSLFPHLFYPQRILSFGKTRESKSISTIDKLLRRDRESASFPIITANYPDFAELKQNFQKGVLLYEYLFDRNQAIIELLKISKELGAQIFIKQPLFEAKVSINCLPFNRNQSFIDIKGTTLKYKNSIKVATDNFDLHLLRYYNGTSVQLNTQKGVLHDKLDSEISNILDQLHYKLPFDLNTHAIQLQPITAIEQINETSFNLADSKLETLKDDIQYFQKIVTVKSKLKINVNNIFEDFRENEMNGEKFRYIQNECNEKFDLAKQTGIEYNWFLHVFYRYRNYIDSIIDEAYEQMNVERNPELIWKHVINKHQNEQKKLTNNPH